MHLGDRGCGDRRPELGEQRVDGGFERVFDRLSRFVLREGRQAVLERREIGGELAADDVVAGGEELAELDVGRPKRGERRGQPRLVGHVVACPICLVFAERRGHAAEERKRRRQTQLVGKHAGARPGNDSPCLRQSHHVGNCVHCLRAARLSGSPQSRR